MPGRRVLLYFKRPQKCIFHQIVQIGQSTCLQRPAHCSYPTIYQSQGVEDIVVVKKCFMHSWSVHSAYGIGYYLLCHAQTYYYCDELSTRRQGCRDPIPRWMENIPFPQVAFNSFFQRSIITLWCMVWQAKQSLRLLASNMHPHINKQSLITE